MQTDARYPDPLRCRRKGAGIEIGPGGQKRSLLTESCRAEWNKRLARYRFRDNLAGKAWCSVEIRDTVHLIVRDGFQQ